MDQSDGVPHRSRDGARLAAALLSLWALLAAITLGTGNLPLTFHDGDATHLAALVLRIASGEVPHLDFVTPVGIGAVWPIAGFVQLGWGLGMAFLLAQASVAALLLPALWWVGMDRFGAGWRGFAFGGFALILVMAVTHGDVTTQISVSMHYNRWAWAVAYVVLGLILLPPQGHAPRIEGLMLGAGFTVLALTKVTFFVGLLPVALIALAIRRQRGTTIWALGTGIALVLLITLAVGPAFWAGYAGDLLAVGTSNLRPNPGVPLTSYLFGLEHLVPTAVLLAAVWLVWQRAGAPDWPVWAAAVPALLLITWQNFGNEPVWLPIVALALLTLRPVDSTKAQPFVLAACVAGAFALPSVINLAQSPVRMAFATGDSAPLLSGLEGHDDYRITQPRLTPGPWGVPSPLAEQGNPEQFWGGSLPECRQAGAGMPTYIAMAREAAQAGFAGRPALVADYLQSLWLFADFPPLPGGSPWYYGNLAGLANAEIMVVPLCAQGPAYRRVAIAALEASGRPVAEVFRGDFAVVLEIGP